MMVHPFIHSFTCSYKFLQGQTLPSRRRAEPLMDQLQVKRQNHFLTISAVSLDQEFVSIICSLTFTVLNHVHTTIQSLLNYNWIIILEPSYEQILVHDYLTKCNVFDLIPITCISAIILFNRSIIKISKATSVILYFIWLWYCKCTMALVICPPRAVVVHNHQVEVRCYYTYNIYWTKNLLGLEEEVVKGVKIHVTSCRSSWEKCRPLPDTKKKKR